MTADNLGERRQMRSQPQHFDPWFLGTVGIMLLSGGIVAGVLVWAWRHL